MGGDCAGKQACSGEWAACVAKVCAPAKAEAEAEAEAEADVSAEPTCAGTCRDRSG